MIFGETIRCSKCKGRGTYKRGKKDVQCTECSGYGYMRVPIPIDGGRGSACVCACICELPATLLVCSDCQLSIDANGICERIVIK